MRCSLDHPKPTHAILRALCKMYSFAVCLSTYKDYEVSTDLLLDRFYKHSFHSLIKRIGFVFYFMNILKYYLLPSHK